MNRLADIWRRRDGGKRLVERSSPSAALGGEPLEGSAAGGDARRRTRPSSAALRGAAVLVGVALVSAAVWFCWPVEVPSLESVRARWTPSDAYLLDRHGEVIDRQRVDFKVRRTEWVPLEAVSPALSAAIIDGEDRRFWEHSGVDWRALLGALRDNSIGPTRRGASTISMQVAALLDPRFRAGNGSGAWSRKIAQIRMARALDGRWTKHEILEAYLNLLGFRGELQGIGATSQVLAGKAPAGLTLSESLVLAALLPAPHAKPDRVINRACTRAAARRLPAPCDAIRTSAMSMLASAPGAQIDSATSAAAPSASMNATSAATAAASSSTTVAADHPDKLMGSPLQNAPGNAHRSREPSAVRLAPHLARALLKKPGERVRTTLDIQVQRLAVNVLHEHLSQLTSRNVRDGAVLIVENDTGNVLAYVASAGPESTAKEVDGIRARRQAGSTLKPFLYEMAIERRYLTAASLLNDTPLTLDTASGIYLPQDYDRDFKGLVSVRTALGSSLNIPAVRALMLVGVEPFRERLHALGYAGITQPGDFYGYSLALGSAEVSLWEQVQAYRTLARGGQWSPIQLAPAQTQTNTSRLPEDATFIISDILSDRAARTLTFGLDNRLNTPFWSAAKTGTSKDMRDNWCIGFSQHFTVGVWVGNFEGDSMHDVSGITGAAPVWQQIMLALHARLSSPPPEKPASVTTTLAKFSPAVEPPRHEHFLVAQGSKMDVIRVAGDIARIASPANGMVIAIDPDIPPKFQRVPLSARGADARMVLKLNGTVLGPATRNVMWSPERGAYLLALEDGAGRTLDAAHFIVR